MTRLNRYDQSASIGLGYGLFTYVAWGFFPLYFHSLAPAGAFEVICHRAIWGLVFSLAALAILPRGFAALKAALSNPQLTVRLAIAGFLIIGNWTSYVYAVLTDRTIDASLGYFINPLITVALGRVFLRERLTRLQGVALALGAGAVLVLAIGLEHFPWLAIVMPTTFAGYSLVKKKIALDVTPVVGLSIETGVVTPIMIAYLVYLCARGETSFHVLTATGSPASSIAAHAALLVGAGAITLVPLLTLAVASRTLSLSLLGLLQYISPVMQLIVATVVFKEVVEPMRWAGSALVWAAIVVLLIDGAIRARQRKRRHG
ncbi:MAG: EamA family transporter RarD [Actinomycetaceae bacterium]|nr:EamA family transporter RarD [Actinomycetaceae bacterium]